MPQGDLSRLRRLASDKGLTALLAFTPQNFQYLTGFATANTKVTGIFSALMPVDPSLGTAATVGEFDLVWAQQKARVDELRPIGLWIEIDDRGALEDGNLTTSDKPVQFDPNEVVSILRNLLGDRGLLKSRVGIDEATLPMRLYRQLQDGLRETDLVDAGEIFRDARTIKTQSEIEALRRAVELTELGIRAILVDSDPRGQTVSQLRIAFERAVLAVAAEQPDGAGYQASRVYISSGGDIGPNTGRHSQQVEDGHIVWIDAGCQIDGYAADIGRTFAVGHVPSLAHQIADAIMEGSASGFDHLQPGRPMKEVYTVTQDTIRKTLPSYSRGHFGHGIGLGIGERPPYISASNERVFETGMTMAYERPYYVRGLGGFQFEDNFVLTDEGIDLFTSLPQALISI